MRSAAVKESAPPHPSIRGRTRAGAPRRRAAKLVKVDLEPVVDLLVDRVVLVADLLAGGALLERLGLSRGAVLVGAADEDRVVAAGAAVPRVHVRGEHAADDVAEVGHVVDVGQRGGDEDVAGAWLREAGRVGGGGGRRGLGYRGHVGPIGDLEGLERGGALWEVLYALQAWGERIGGVSGRLDTRACAFQQKLCRRRDERCLDSILRAEGYKNDS